MVAPGPLLLPNFGAEEGPRWRELRRAPAVAALGGLWRLLFGVGAEWVGVDAAAGGISVGALGEEPETPAFAWLPGAGALAAWLNTEEAATEARSRGCELYGAPPGVVATVHDKAFAAAVAEREGLVPAALQGCSAILDPADLADPERASSRIAEALAGWPAWARRRFTLKPRLGTSGRGRAAGAGDRVDAGELGRACARLARRGGAVLEPWLERSADLSAQLHVGADGLVLIGTTRQLVTRSGVYRGHAGLIDRRGRVTSGSPHDEALREAAIAVASAARAAGYTGPCSVDALVFRDPDGREVLRPVVELNARFSAGTVALGLVRRALPAIRAGTRVLAGERRAFCFRLDAPAGGWPEGDADLLVLPLAEPGAPARPALAVARSPDDGLGDRLRALAGDPVADPAPVCA